MGSSGPHTNGYTLIRDLLAKDPSLARQPLGSSTFLEAVLEPHRCDYQSIKGLFEHHLVGMAHITGGGIRENLDRILPPTVNARIDLAQYRPPPVFQAISEAAQASEELMLRTFNMGVGMTLVCRPEVADAVLTHLADEGELAYFIGEVVTGSGRVDCFGRLPQA